MKALRHAGAALLAVSLLTMATPRQAHAYVDPGSSTMLWQLAAAVAIGCLCYVRSVARLMRKHLSLQSHQARGFLFSGVFAAAVSPVAMRAFGGNPPPRFNDIFLVGIVLTAYLFTWEASAFLLGISALVSAWLLPPQGSFWIEGGAEWYRLVSFVLLSVFLILVISRAKTHAHGDPVENPESEAAPIAGAAAGD